MRSTDGSERYFVFDRTTVYAHVRVPGVRNYGASFTLQEGSSHAELVNVGMAILAFLQGPQREEFRRGVLEHVKPLRVLVVDGVSVANANRSRSGLFLPM